MTLTTEFCPMGDSIMANVKEALRMSLPGIEPEVQLTRSSMEPFHDLRGRT